MMKFFYCFLFAGLVITGCNNNASVEDETGTDTLSTNDTVAVNEKQQEVSDEFLLDNLLAYNSEEELIAAFGKENIITEHRWGAEGEYEYKASILYPETKNQVEFAWEDSVSLSGLSSICIYIFKETPDWYTSYGIKIGTTMKELEEMNGKPFRFWGFDWDYSGGAFFEEGNLANLNMHICLNTPPGAPEKEAGEMIGDMEFTSDDAIAKKVNPIVVEITMVKPQN
ncbi:MAG: hypothetical protein ABIJ16_08065 [Bacteroidota bacterium]